MDDEQKEVWAIVVSTAGKRIGKVVQNDEGDDYITLCPCFEYLSELQIGQGPQGQMAIHGRTKILMPYDHTMAPHPVTMRVHEILLIDDEMKTRDEKDYKDYIEVITKTCEKMEQERIRRSSNLIIASTIPGERRAP